jgi:hypothetical protein
MDRKAKRKTKPNPKPCEECEHHQDLTQKLKLSEVLTRAIAKFEERIAATDFSPSVGDYIKLVQMKKDLEEATDEAKEIKVTWVEPATSDTEK